jgi:hypothetical protein
LQTAISALAFLRNTPLSIWAVFYSKMGKMGGRRWGNFQSFPNVRLDVFFPKKTKRKWLFCTKQNRYKKLIFNKLNKFLEANLTLNSQL